MHQPKANSRQVFADLQVNPMYVAQMYPKEYICFYVALMDAAWMQALWMGRLTMQLHSEADHQSPQFSLGFPQKRKWNLFVPSRCYLFAIELKIWVDHNLIFISQKKCNHSLFTQPDFLRIRCMGIQYFKAIAPFVYIRVSQKNFFLNFVLSVELLVQTSSQSPRIFFQPYRPINYR